MARIVIEEPCQHETGVEHPGCGYLAHILCRKCGWVQGPHDCTVRRVLDPGSIPDHVIEAAAAELTLDDYACQDDPEGGLDMVRRSLRAALDALARGEQP